MSLWDIFLTVTTIKKNTKEYMKLFSPGKIVEI